MSNITTENLRLGKGLEALIPKTHFASGKTVINIPLDEIKENPFQPRQMFSEESLHGLVTSIKNCGVLQPIIVRKKDGYYELVAGERRFRACQIALMQTIPAIIKDLNDKESMQIALIENLQREDLGALEKADGFQRLIQDYNLTHQELADFFGKSRSAITNTIRLLALPLQIKEALNRGDISEGHARSLLSIKDESEMLMVYRKLLEKELNVRQTENIILQARNSRENVKVVSNERFLSFANEIKNKKGLLLNIKGSEKRGRIEIKYRSQEELESLCSFLSQ
ncbi:MAG: ParB/RepB/Spo0J family partition protein [Candidatus Margulisiibacteriota bacterium]